jgi:hypothetical protein
MKKPYPYGLLTHLAAKYKVDRSTVFRIAHNEIKTGNPAIRAELLALTASGWTRYDERNRKLAAQT